MTEDFKKSIAATENAIEKSAAAKAFLYCPIPVLDVVVGLVVLSVVHIMKKTQEAPPAEKKRFNEPKIG